MTKQVLLIDADSIIPNLALMKLSSYHKDKGDRVRLLRLSIPYNPGRKKRIHKVNSQSYDKVYCSSVFSNSYKYVHGKDIIYGGTGSNNFRRKLPSIVENQDCDYTIYPDNTTSYGFLSRGCIRKCTFCIVPEKEGKIKQVSTIDKIVKHKLTKFLDNNFLALPNHVDLLKELIDKAVKCQFNQGLDIRLVTKTNAELLGKLNYYKEYIFAFDNYGQYGMIERKLKLLTWKRPFLLKFFVYVHPRMSFSNIVQRVKWLKERQCLPYIMRDITCWSSKNDHFYKDISAWCNQVHLFKKMPFGIFLEKTYPSNIERVKNSLFIYNSN